MFIALLNKPVSLPDSILKNIKKNPLKNKNLIHKVEKRLHRLFNPVLKKIILNSSGILVTKEDYTPFDWNKIDILNEIDYVYNLIEEYAEEDWANDSYGFDTILEDNDPLLPIGINGLGDTYVLDLNQMHVQLLYHDEPVLDDISSLDNFLKSKPQSSKSSLPKVSENDLKKSSFLLKILPKNFLKDTSIIDKVEKIIGGKLPLPVRNMIINSSGILGDKKLNFLSGYTMYHETFRGLNWNYPKDVLSSIKELQLILKENTEDRIGPYTIKDLKYLIPIGDSYGGDIYVLDTRSYKVYEYFRDNWYKEGVWLNLSDIIKY